MRQMPESPVGAGVGALDAEGVALGSGAAALAVGLAVEAADGDAVLWGAAFTAPEATVVVFVAVADGVERAVGAPRCDDDAAGEEVAAAVE